MIIKSLSRKASGGARGGKSPFHTLIRYMARDTKNENGRSVLWHNFFGSHASPEAEILQTFESNARFLKERKNGNVLYHEMLSFSAGHRLQGEALYRAVADIGQEYLRERAPNQLGYGVIHLDTDHIHLHLLISANEVGKSDRVRLSKQAFADIQKRVEHYTRSRYPELNQDLVYDRGNAKNRERLKTNVHEQAMKARTGTQSRKEALKASLHQVFERAESGEEFQSLAASLGVAFYTRGTSVGVVVRDPDGQERKHRLSSLGVMEHYELCQARLSQGRQAPAQVARESTKHKQERDMPETRVGGGGTVWGTPEPSAPEIVAEELATGKLHPKWHSEPSKAPETPRDGARYSDDILKRAQEREAGRDSASPSRSAPTRDRGGDER